jgi:hypothetical protein
MRLTNSEIYLILGAIDTHELELIEQDSPMRDSLELKQLRELCSKLVTELKRRAKAGK